MEEEIKEVETFTVKSSDEAFEIVDKKETDSITEDLMKKILGENVAISVGNYIFIPPLENPKVSSPEKTHSLITNPNFSDNYIKTKINIDGTYTFFVTHISRIVHEGQPTSVQIYPIDKFNEKDLKIAFKNEFPPLFVTTLQLLNDYKKVIENKG